MPGVEKSPFAPLDMTSFAALILAAALFFYVAFYRTAEQSRRQFAELTRKAEEELKTLGAAQARQAAARASADKPVAGGPGAREGNVADLPALLQKISVDTLQSSMEISQIEKIDAERYRLTAQAPFERLLQFLLRVEQSNLALEEISIHPLPGARDQVKLLLRVLGGEMSLQNRCLLDELQKPVPAVMRNPFKRDGRTSKASGLPDQMDLTWKFKLTSIGVDPKGRYATIDRKVVHKGDVFNGMVVTEVGADRVELKSDTQKVVIAFRIKAPRKP
ncbi:MAG: type II secretion system protein M [Deltaproteobacteria bacterium]|nr:type II secretion system protein M [Deltaproteobacteria bacterium]